MSLIPSSRCVSGRGGAIRGPVCTGRGDERHVPLCATGGGGGDGRRAPPQPPRGTPPARAPPRPPQPCAPRPAALDLPRPRRSRFTSPPRPVGWETCPVSTGGGTRRVQSVREGGGGGAEGSVRTRGTPPTALQPPAGAGTRVRDAACPLSTRGGTRLVRLVRGRGGGGGKGPPAGAGTSSGSASRASTRSSACPPPERPAPRARAPRRPHRTPSSADQPRASANHAHKKLHTKAAAGGRGTCAEATAGWGALDGRAVLDYARLEHAEGPARPSSAPAAASATSARRTASDPASAPHSARSRARAEKSARSACAAARRSRFTKGSHFTDRAHRMWGAGALRECGVPERGTGARWRRDVPR